jgi:hypothetical protein
MKGGRLTCPKCGVLLKHEDIMPRSSHFPCPTCAAKLQVPGYYLDLIWAIAIALPILLLRALGLSWLHLVLPAVIVIYPLVYLGLRYVKYIIPPKIQIAVPVKTVSEALHEGNQRTELDLHDKRHP